MRELPKYAVLGLLLMVALTPVVVGSLIAWKQIRVRVDPPPEMRHATATDVSGFEEISLSTADLGGLRVTKVFVGPMVDRPQDRIIAPGAALVDKNRPGNAFGEAWIAHGNYPGGCFVSVYRIENGKALDGVDGLSDAQRAEVSRGEKMVLEMKFACGEG